MKLSIKYWAIVIVFLINACHATEDQESSSSISEEAADLGRIDALPLRYKSPDDNPATVEKIELGRLLFYDPVLSGPKDVACATCHHPEFGYAESIDLSIGVNGQGLGEKRAFNDPNEVPFVKRNSQSLLNTAFNGIDMNGRYSPEKAPMFWDLRADNLEHQAMMPIKTMEEMRGAAYPEEDISAEIVSRLNRIPEYRKLFKNVFKDAGAITEANISKSLAAFQRSLIANNSRFDQYMRGDKSALTDGEVRGMEIFIETGCARCHNGPMLSDFKTHVLGVADNEKRSESDSGYEKTYAFRTPSLRNLRFTRPYMHSGKIANLESVMFFYEDLQGKELPNAHVSKDRLDPHAKALKVEFKNISSIIEFLNTLNDGKYDKKMPKSVPSGLPVGGSIQ
jgi:cytochrome c peroxidase